MNSYSELAKVIGGVYGDYDYGADDKANSYGHYTDKGKLPWHPTFSGESIYSDEEMPGGEWEGKKTSDGKTSWNYTPSQRQVQGEGYDSALLGYYLREKGKGIDSVKYPVPYATPSEYK